jgi:hypothetical protein
VEFSGVGRFSIAGRREGREVRGQGWAVGREGREVLRAHGDRCIRRGLRREGREGRDSGQGWVRGQDLEQGRDSGSGPDPVVRLRCRLRVKRLVRRVRGREGADGRGTRRPKKVR